MNSKKLFKLLLQLIILIVIIIVIHSAFNLKVSDGLFVVAKSLGTFSAICFCAVLIPGILRRVKIVYYPFKVVSDHIMFARAQVGLVMFFAALGHYFLRVITPLLRNGIYPDVNSAFIFGFLSLFLSFWLALTSNQFSKKLLKRNWKRLHSLVYLIVWTIFLHIVLLEISPLSILVLLFAVAETYSLFVENVVNQK